MKVRFWEKWLVKLGIVFLRRPYKNWIQDPVKDFVMAFHYCPKYQKYRFDTFFNPLSKSAYFVCGECGEYNSTNEGIGILLFQIIECSRIANAVYKNKFRQLIMFFWFMIFGLGKYLPDSREEKTAGELEWEAMNLFLSIFMNEFNNF
ncbi:hypothetical protein ACFLZ0_01870 [Patescibacteria group bacterium]